ncbi:MAG: AgmX/PglI C-terminal domain-containing protein [Myxococcaceae bacterium]
MNPGSAEWLFRQGELVLGPVTAEAMIEKLYAGEVDSKTPVTKMGDSNFRRLGEFDVFRVHVAKAEAKARVDKQAVTDAHKRAKSRNVKIGITAGVIAVLAIAVGIGAYRIAIDNPFKNVEQEAYGDILISSEVGSIGLAKAHHEDEELLDYQFTGQQKKNTGTAVAQNEKKQPSEDKLPKDTGTKLASAKKNKVNDETEEPDGMQMAKFDQSAINGVVASQQKTLYPCLIAEAQKNPGLSAKIPIEFVIGNDGKVAKVWVDHPSFKSGSLPDCLLTKLQGWKFKPYDGERATVSLSFKIGKSG